MLHTVIIYVFELSKGSKHVQATKNMNCQNFDLSRAQIMEKSNYQKFSLDKDFFHVMKLNSLQNKIFRLLILSK